MALVQTEKNRCHWRPIFSWVVTLACTATISSFLAPNGSANDASQRARPQPLVVFAPESHFPPKPGSDFLQLFDANAQWREAQKRTDVFQLSQQFYAAAPAALLAKVVQFLASARIGLGIEVESLAAIPGSAAGCAPKLNSTGPRTILEIVRKIKTAGGKLVYIAMDEPLFYGVFSTRAGDCLSPPETIGKRVEPVMSPLLSAFPDAKLGDTEPFPVISQHPGWDSAFSQWIASFRRALGRPLDFIQLDFDWRHPALTKSDPDITDAAAITRLAHQMDTVMRHAHLEVGMIINGKASAQNDRQWTDEAQRNLDIIEASQIRPDQLIFASWHVHPDRSMPESDASTLTSLIVRNVP